MYFVLNFIYLIFPVVTASFVDLLCPGWVHHSETRPQLRLNFITPHRAARPTLLSHTQLCPTLWVQNKSVIGQLQSTHTVYLIQMFALEVSITKRLSRLWLSWNCYGTRSSLCLLREVFLENSLIKEKTRCNYKYIA